MNNTSLLCHLLLVCIFPVCLDAQEEKPRVAETNLFLTEIFLETDLINELFAPAGEDPFGVDSDSFDPLDSSVPVRKDVSSVFHRWGMNTLTKITWDGGNRISVLGTLEDIRTAKKMFKPLCCDPLQVRFALFELSFPAKDFGAKIRHPEKLNAEVLRRFAAGEGELRRADSVLGLSGVEAQLGECTLLATVAPDNETINVQFQHRGDQVTQTSFITEAGSPLLVQSHASGDHFNGLVLLANLVDRAGKPRPEEKGMIPLKKISGPQK